MWRHSFITWQSAATPAAAKDPQTILVVVVVSYFEMRPFVVATSTARGFYSGRLALLFQP